MPAAYVILSHGEGGQIPRLARAILSSSPDATVFVTHDARRGALPSLEVERVHSRAHGRRSDWGSWDLVAVTLEAMQWARDTVDPDLVVVLSGQCYPARPLLEWESELRAAGGGWQGTATPLVYTPAWGRRQGSGDDNLTRYAYRWFRARPIDGALRAEDRSAKVMWAVAHRTEPVLSLRNVSRGRGAYVGLRRLESPRRRRDRGAVYMGSQWLAMDRRLLATVLEELTEGSELRRRYEHSIIPDESAIQTVLARVQPPTVSVPTSYCVWEPDKDETRTMTVDDLADIRASTSPFCRKVDPDRSAELLDALDRSTGVA
ncbi:hypothetical protein FHX52_1917 [Humibacillus xanthopallidus]|uniref:Core-2/I-Branching enzyme n=1 Tax=Humibacillus xanthopallidus TaxID=412689 RepID=A0A543PXJ7_9MICO|nr:hypothetical protein [Humibacillus xanthopallidus]TQN48771.1 hypothetical protein FHX52_1917 [Humibacillus xanthopallidus]